MQNELSFHANEVKKLVNSNENIDLVMNKKLYTAGTIKGFLHVFYMVCAFKIELPEMFSNVCTFVEYAQFYPLAYIYCRWYLNILSKNFIYLMKNTKLFFSLFKLLIVSSCISSSNVLYMLSSGMFMIVIISENEVRKN